MIISDEMLRENAEKAAQLYLERIDVEYGQESEHVFSRRFERRMRRIIKDQKRSPAKRKFISIMQKVAVAVLVLLVGTFTTTMSVKAYREEFISFIKRVTHRATSIEYRIGDVEYCEVDLSKTVFGYLPEGYEIVEEGLLTERIAYYKLADANSHLLFIDLTVVTDYSTGVLSLNTENTEVSYPVINGEEALLSVDSEGLILVWSRRNVILEISGVVSEEDAIEIAKNIDIFFVETQ